MYTGAQSTELDARINIEGNLWGKRGRALMDREQWTGQLLKTHWMLDQGVPWRCVQFGLCLSDNHLRTGPSFLRATLPVGAGV